jgi:hypothetical protein
MNFDDAKTALKEGYQKAGLELVDEHETELFFRYQGNNFVIPKEEIDEYAISSNSFSTLQTIPEECSICSTTYREHVLEIPDLILRRVFTFGPRDENYIFGNPDNGSVYVSIGQASILFINYFRFNEAYQTLHLDRLRRPFSRSSSTGKLEIQENLFRPLTIKIHNLQESSVDGVIKQTTPLIDACLFEFSYLKNITFTLSEGWHVRQPRIKRFIFGDQNSSNQFTLPSASFNSDTIRFYQRGMSTGDSVNQFLAFYQVLEYFFIEVSDEQLYNRLSRRINDPRFSTSPKNLDQIIQEVANHKRVTDETEMLKAVLNKFVDENELLDFIRAYETYLGKKIYTKKRSIFGEDIQVDTSAGYIIPNVAKVVKTIRNALVHSSDRYERKDRYIPSTSSENLIKREIPLIKFLAEKVIIASAK